MALCGYLFLETTFSMADMSNKPFSSRCKQPWHSNSKQIRQCGGFQEKLFFRINLQPKQIPFLQHSPLRKVHETERRPEKLELRDERMERFGGTSEFYRSHIPLASHLCG